VVICRTAKR